MERTELYARMLSLDNCLQISIGDCIHDPLYHNTMMDIVNKNRPLNIVLWFDYSTDVDVKENAYVYDSYDVWWWVCVWKATAICINGIFDLNSSNPPKVDIYSFN